MTTPIHNLHLGDYREVLAEVTCDALICDPPYGARTHKGHDAATQQVLSATGQKTRRNLNYSAWTPDDVREFVAFWAPRTRGWMFCMTSDDLIPHWREAYKASGRLDFAPVGLLMYHPRLLGDGPSSGIIYCMASRPRSRDFQGGWSNPPWYGPVYPAHNDKDQHIGGKPVSIMRQIVRDYSRTGNVVCDPCAGGASTGIAAMLEGRDFVGAEIDPETHAKGKARLDANEARLFAQPALFDAKPQKLDL
jgi:predicted RNA methylase